MSCDARFRRLSARIGADPLLVQGPGGNTSVKDGRRMWIKASGTELADALAGDIFVAVDLAQARAAIDDGSDGSCQDAVCDGPRGLRPSIETTFHALLAQRYVFHYHSVRAISHSICAAGRAALAAKLDGLGAWAQVGYHQPGVPLTRALRAALPAGGCGILVLRNHGLIIAAEQLDQVERLIDAVEQALEMPRRSTAPTAAPDDLPGWQAAASGAVLAVNARMCELACAGSYYPDHVVFLGPALPRLNLAQLRAAAGDDFDYPAVLVPGVGAYLKRAATPAQRAMLGCLAEVLGRLPDDWQPQPIGAQAEARLLNWDAEKYRQALAARRRADG